MKNAEKKRHVLIVVSGMSPAVITETVWAMAMLKEPIVPDKVVVLTTMGGKSKILQSMCFENGVPGKKSAWAALMKTLSANGLNTTGRLIFTEQTIKVFTGEDEKPLDDLRTRAENLLAANLMMKEIREYTEDEDWIVHAQLAGGRKTMSALFFSSMCLLGRPCDHIYHVLVGEGYDNPRLEPPFFFPQKGVMHKNTGKDGKTERLVSVKALVELFDVPFVPMGEWAEQKCKAVSKRLNYENIIGAVNAGIGEEIYPRIEVDVSGRGSVFLNGVNVKLSHFEFALFIFVIQGRCAAECLESMRELKNYLCCEDVAPEIFDHYPWLEHYMGDEEIGFGKFAWCKVLDKRKQKEKIAHDLSSTLSTLRDKLPQTSSMNRLVNRDSFPADFDISKVSWRGYDSLSAELAERLFTPAMHRRLKIDKRIAAR